MRIHFARGNVRPDTPLLYLLPIFGILLLILIWLALSDLLSSERDRVVREALARTTGNARAFERSTDQLLRHIDQVTRLVQYEFEKSRQRGESFELGAVVRQSLVSLDALAAITIVDRAGMATTVAVPGAPASGATSGAADAGDVEALRTHRDANSGKLHVGKPVVSRTARKTVIPMSRRLNNPDGTFAGIVVVAADPARFTEPAATMDVGREGVVALLGDDGVFRARRIGQATTAGGAVEYAATLAALQRAEKGGVTIAGPGDTVVRFAAHRPLTPYSLIAIVGTAENDVLAGYREQRADYIKYAVIASLVITGVLTIAMLLVIQLKRSHHEAEQARATYRAAAEGSLDAFFLLRTVRGRDGKVSEFVVEDANSRALLLLKQPRESVIGMRLRTLIPKIVRRRLYRRYFKSLETGKPIEEEIETAFGRYGARWFRHQVVPLADHLAVTLRDIDEAKQTQHNLERAANFDSLTSLPNRRQFIEHAGSAIERCRARGTNLGVLFIDLDNFKNVNDTLGHDVGDLLLQAVSVRLQSCIRSDDILWRLGGDEFIVTMEDVPHRAEAEVVCRRIADVFAPPIVVREISISTSASIGVAFCPEDAEDANTLLKNADLAMYNAKEFGSGAYQFYTTAMGVRRAARIDIEQDLRDALRRYELFLVYQPQIRLSDGKVTGLEALVRWQHPENGVMHPMEFIPVAEESNLIHLLGDYVIQIACSQIQRWQAMGMEAIPIAVNVSPRQFHWEGIAERVLSIVAESGIPPGTLQIELTESAIMRDLDGARRKLSELKRHGISLSVDDFGTGHSSLASLQSFPIDTLKIDRSFVQRSGSQDGVAILRAIVLMAHTLRMNVVAEGVETEAQLALLTKIGCDQAQGFLIAHPSLADDVPAMLKRLEENSTPERRRVYAHS